MILNLIKKFWNEYSPILIAIFVTVITNSVVNFSDLQEAIVSNSVTASLIIIFILQEILIFSISFFINVLIDRIKKYLVRNRIRQKKYNPLASKNTQDISADIEKYVKESVCYFDNYKKHKDFEKAYFLKQSIYKLKEATYIVANIIRYQNVCITNNDEYPSESKFTSTDVSWFCKIIMEQYHKIDEEILSFIEIECISKNEKDFIKKLLHLVDITTKGSFDKYKI